MEREYMEQEVYESVVETLKRDEGYRKDIYDLDGVLHIGYGYAVGHGMSEGLAEFVLRFFVMEKAKQLHRAWPAFHLMPLPVKAAILNLCYQVGVAGFMKFKKAIVHLEQGKWSEAADEMLDSRWAKQTPARAQRVTNLVRLTLV